jgi:hypothetical protein
VDSSKIIVAWVMTYMILGMSIDLYLSPSLFEDNPDYWRVFNLLSSEFIFASITALVGIIPLIGLALENLKIVRVGLIIACVFWCFMAVIQTFGRGYYEYNTGLVVYTGLAVLCLWTSKKGGEVDESEQI